LAIYDFACRSSSRAASLSTTGTRRAAIRCDPVSGEAKCQRDAVALDLMVVPLVDFEPDQYRLGNGGGYFDRTLATPARGSAAIGVCYALGEVETIHP